MALNNVVAGSVRRYHLSAMFLTVVFGAMVAVIFASDGIWKRSTAVDELTAYLRMSAVKLPAKVELSAIPVLAERNAEILQAWHVHRGGETVAYVYVARVARAYNGPLIIVVLLGTSGEIIDAGLAVHRETPGYGARLAAADGPWWQQLRGRRLNEQGADTWQIAAGEAGFDALSGATVTSNAIIRGLRPVLAVDHELRNAAQR